MDHALFSTTSCSSVLAYVHYYTCKFVPGRCLTGQHLRRLSAWLYAARPQLRSARQHPVLAGHLVLLHGAGLLRFEPGVWLVAPTAYQWLLASEKAQLLALVSVVGDGRWETSAGQLGLNNSLTPDYRAYIEQLLDRQMQRLEEEMAVQQVDKPCLAVKERAWHLAFGVGLLPQQRFELLQLGEWLPAERGVGWGVLILTPMTLMSWFAKGGTLLQIKRLLDSVLSTSLTIEQVELLIHWYGQSQQYRVQQAWLLETKQPEQLTEIVQDRRLRRHVRAQLGTRLAMVEAEMVPRLRKWLAARGEVLQVPVGKELSDTVERSEVAYSWLGLQVLAGLRAFLPLRVPLPHDALEVVGAELTAVEQTELQQLADEIVGQVREAIRGRDAFFPAEGAVPEAWLALVREAMVAETAVWLQYQALGERQPSWRRVDPYRLEARNGLFYLYGYCYRTEATLTFRLDRAAAIEEAILD